MKNRGFRFAALAILALALAAFQCPGVTIQLGSTPEPTPIPTNTPAPIATPTSELAATPTPGLEVILEEDFSDNRNDWFQSGPDDIGNEIAVRDGAYHIRSIYEADLDNFLWGGTTVWSFTNFELTVEVTQVAGTDDNEIAVVFGASDADNLYEFAYSGDGYVMLGRYVDGVFEFIRQWDPSEAIFLGEATNEVHLVVEDGTLTAFLNGEQVMVTDVPDYAGGFIGFGCGPFEGPEAHCTFDNPEIGELG